MANEITLDDISYLLGHLDLMENSYIVHCLVGKDMPPGHSIIVRCR